MTENKRRWKKNKSVELTFMWKVPIYPMFDDDVKYMQAPAAKSQFLNLMFNGDKFAEACSFMRVNPGAVAFVRRYDNDFDMDIRHAQAFQIELAVDKLENIPDDYDDPLTMRVVSDNIKWLASKRMRQIYGDKLDIAVVQTIDLKQAISDARQRTIQFIDANVIETQDNATDIKSVEHDDVDPLSWKSQWFQGGGCGTGVPQEKSQALKSYSPSLHILYKIFAVTPKASVDGEFFIFRIFCILEVLRFCAIKIFEKVP